MIAGSQDLWLTGSRLYFQRDAITIAGSPVVQPILDFGTIAPTTPLFTSNPVVLEDSDGGQIHDVAEQNTKMSELYDIKTNNLSMDILQFAFMSGLPTVYNPANIPTGWTTGQPATALTNVQHNAFVGRLMKIHDIAGNPIFGITSIDAIHIGTTGGTAAVPYDPATGIGDYQVVSLERGLIRWLPTSTALTTDGLVFMNVTPRAITGVRRTIYPQTQPCSSTGLALLVFGRCNNAQQSARIARVSLTPKTNVWDVAKWSELGFQLRVLFDPTIATNPAGSFNYWLGDLPSGG